MLLWRWSKEIDGQLVFTAAYSQNSSIGGIAASSSQNSLNGSGATSSSKNSMTGGGESKVTPKRNNVMTIIQELQELQALVGPDRG